MKTIFFIICLLLIRPTSAQIQTFTAVRDNTIYQNTINSNGVGDNIFAGTNAQGLIRRALIAFQLNQLTDSSLIESVALVLTPNKSNSNSPTYFAHRLLSAWGEGNSNASLNEGQGIAAKTGDCTWEYAFYNSKTWKNPGGDFLLNPSAEFISGMQSDTIRSLQLTRDVKDWVASPAKNFGWIIRGNEASVSTAKRFYSRENTIGNGPRLLIKSGTITGLNTFESKCFVSYADKEKITISYLIKPKTIIFFSTSGSLIKELNVNAETITTLDWHDLPDGFYIIKIEGSDNSYSTIKAIK